MAITVIRRRIAEFLTKIERKKCNNTQNIVIDGCYLLFEEYLQEKKGSIYILNPCREIGLSFEKSLRGVKLVKNFEIFWMSNITIIELSLCSDLGGCYPHWSSPRWITVSSICSTLHTILSLIQYSRTPLYGQPLITDSFLLCLWKAVTLSLNPTHLIRTPVHEDNGRLFLAQSTDSHRQSTRANEDPSLSTVCWHDLYINKSSQFSSSRHMDTLVLQR